MSKRKMFTGRYGFSLMETLIAVCIMSVLMGIAGLQYSVWIKRYNVEREIREMRADLMNARARAMMRNRRHFVDLADGQYTVYEDTYDASLGANSPDGDGTLQISSDAVIMRKPTHFIIDPSLGFGARRFYFNNRGLSSQNGSIWLSSDVKADYDCIVLFTTRINIGKWNGSTCKATL